jgi:monoamine oxidase
MADRNRSQVLIAGAGMAGLVAARTLAEAGLKVTIVEARDRVGGRIYTLRDGPVAMEMGAEFVHGSPPEFWNLLHEAGAAPVFDSGESVCQVNGALETCGENGAWELLGRMQGEPDLTFSEWLAQQSASPEAARRATSYIEGFNAADARRIGTAALARQNEAEDAAGGADGYFLPEGYDRLTDFLRGRCEAAGAEILLGTRVESIRWEAGRVIAHGTAGNSKISFESDACVVTIPLGVLQAGGVAIDPMPPRTRQAIDALAMGSARRLVCHFDEPFWESRFPRMGFLFLEPGDASDPADIRTWWTKYPVQMPLLVGWVGGPRAALPIPDREAHARAALGRLAAAFAMNPGELWARLRNWHLHDWQTDPYSLGAYSYAPKGALHASNVLAESLEDTLLFAGEHTDVTGHWGTVHAAMRSGLRAAGQILRSRP